MPSIVLDVSYFYARTNRHPPKNTPVTVVFTANGQRIAARGNTFDIAVNAAKKEARKLNAYTLTLFDFQNGFDCKVNEVIWATPEI